MTDSFPFPPRFLSANWVVGPAILLVGLAVALLPLTWAVLLVLGGIVLVATLIRPQVGLLLLVPAVPFGAVRQVRVGGMNVGVTEVLVALVLAAWLMGMVARRKVRIAWPPLTLPLLFFWGVILLSSLGAVSLRASLKEIIKWSETLALYVMAFNLTTTGRLRRAVVFVMLGTGALAALHGIYQFLFQVGPEEFVLFGRFMRAYGTFEQPNPYAGYLGLTLPLALGFLVASVVQLAAGRRRDSAAKTRGAHEVGVWGWLLWAVGCGGPMLLALVMSWSRGAWLGLAAAVGVMLLAVVVRSGRGAVLIAVLVLLAAYLLFAGGISLIPPAIVQRFGDFTPYLGLADVRGVEVTDANFAVLERMAHWQSALAMWTDHPWLGVGIGNYEAVYGDYALPLWPHALGHAHNYYLNVAAEAGLLGLGAYLLLWGAALLLAWRAARRASGWEWGLALGVLGVLVHLSVHSIFDNLYVHSMYLHLAILLGMLPRRLP